jgi:hypothetical protein
MLAYFIWYPNQLQKNNTESMIELTIDGRATVEQDRVRKSIDTPALPSS